MARKYDIQVEEYRYQVRYQIRAGGTGTWYLVPGTGNLTSRFYGILRLTSTYDMQLMNTGILQNYDTCDDAYRIWYQVVRLEQ